jgi:hypothetical protein
MADVLRSLTATTILVAILVSVATSCCASNRRIAAVTPLERGDFLGAPSTAVRDEILEVVFRKMSRAEPEEREVSHELNRVHKAFFLAIGKSESDPPQELIKRLSDLPVPVKPISEGKWKGFFIFDKTTDERGAALYVYSITMLNKDEADIEAKIHPGGGLSASGWIYRVKRQSGKWIVIGQKLKWIA